MDADFYEEYEQRTPQSPEELEEARQLSGPYRKASFAQRAEAMQIIDVILDEDLWIDLREYEAETLIGSLRNPAIYAIKCSSRIREQRDWDEEDDEEMPTPFIRKQAL